MPFITFEGSEACGKSTQVKRLATRLENNGVVAVVFAIWRHRDWRLHPAFVPAFPSKIAP